MVVKLPLMDSEEIQSLIQSQMLCRIAFRGQQYPYIAPFQYVYLNGALYFHFTDYGRKMKLLEVDDRVCVEIEQLQPDLSEYNFVSLRGTLSVVNDSIERSTVIDQMREMGQRYLSPNFLAAHGIAKENGWSAFTDEKPLVIVKLDIQRKIGIKSPIN
jgi:nitroimidazol reductase NimA-like FMN-containing flavoprotein (pyridoxamine 5'-phosphate oxidase superfamily)